MNEKHLDDIEARIKAATPGPWKAFRVAVGGGTTSGVFEPIPGAKGTENYARPITGWFNSHRRAMDSDAQHADADLIAHAPDDLTRTTNALRAVLAELGDISRDATAMICTVDDQKRATGQRLSKDITRIRRAITDALQGEQ